jgi:glycosyltransferase involved in cell wall biosynthesis
MINIFFVSSENNNSFGVNQVLYNLKNSLRTKCHIKSSGGIWQFINNKYNLIHIHGCWKIHIIFYFIFSKIMNRKIIVSPHGMLDPYSLNQKKIIKSIFWHLFQKHIFNLSDQIIVNSINEKKNILKIISHKNIIIIPHGVQFRKQKYNIKKKNKEKLRFVFFSRIDRVKNLETLLKIWSNSLFLKKFDLSIYGQISDHKYFNLIKKKFLIFNNINYYGPLYKNKIKVLSKHDIFIFPSKSENFGLVVLEALAAGLYIILNKKLPWNDLAFSGFVSSIHFNNNNLVNVIKKLEKKKNELRSLNYFKKTQVLLHKKYNWKNISDLYLFNYKKLIR